MEENRPGLGRSKAGFDEARTLPVIVLVRKDLAELHRIFDGRRLAVARSIYVAFVQRIGDDEECTRKELADDAGVTKKTLDEYVPVFIEAGIIERERRYEDGLNLPNRWRVCSVPPEGARSVPTHADDPQQSSSPSASGADGRSGAPACLPGLSVGYSTGEPRLPMIGDVEVTPDLLRDAEELLRQKRKVDGRMVNPEEMAIAVVVIAEFNRQADAEFGVGAHLRAIVGRVRERPSYDAAAHARLVQSAWRLKWWERNGRGRRATPAVVYGNPQVFEQVVQDAVDEKRGKVRDDTPPTESSARFDRQD